MSKHQQIMVAKQEAKRFLSRVKEYEEHGSKDDWTCRKRAAVKRASMDLSNALADVRRAGE